MAELPGILLGVASNAGTVSWGVFTSGVTGIRVGAAGEVAFGALMLYWPGNFPWTGEAVRLRRDVVERAGEVLPLVRVLRRMGVRPGRGLDGLLRALVPEAAEIVDPEHLVRTLLMAVVERLREFSGNPAGMEPRVDPAPLVRDDMAALPDAPGVYEFLAADGRAVYVGKARSLARRVPQHFVSESRTRAKGERLAARSRRLVWQTTGSELEAILVEYLRIRRSTPALNRQERVARRPRGALRNRRLCLVLPSSRSGFVEVCLVSGEGEFHWERVRRARRVPRGLWRRVRAFTEGAAEVGIPREPALAPGEPAGDLPPAEAAALAELTLSWLARRGDAVTRLDLGRETAGRELMARLRALLGEDPRDGRVALP